MKYFNFFIVVFFTIISDLNAQDSTATIHRKHISIDFDKIDNSESNKFNRWVFNAPILYIDSSDYQFAFTPIFDFQVGKAGEQNTMQNTRGALIQGEFFDKVTFASAIYENQSIAPGYVQNFTNTNYVYPGGSRIKAFKENGFDYYYASSFLNYKPSKYFDIEVGHGKNFIGEGYRSLLLSDNAFNYPYLKLSTRFWKIRYTNLYAELTDIYDSGNADQLFDKKYFATHTLDLDLTDWLTVGVFETVIWGKRGFELQYLNPIVFFRAVEFSVGSPDNVMLGASFNLEPIKDVNLYGQLILDEFLLGEVKAQSGWWANKYGGQIGLKGEDIAGIENLDALVEYNIVRPYTYTHWDRINNYGHYNYALAHPSGANFKELIFKTGYEFKGIYVDLKYNKLLHGRDSLNAVLTNGGDIFRSYNDHAEEYGNFIGQGVAHNLSFVEMKMGYIINPSIKMRVELSLLRRQLTLNGVTESNNWMTFGFKTLLPNRYFDFI